jgi:hypothetical protein
MCELQEYYETSSSHVDNWEVNNKCCAFSVQYKQWYRAIIVELLPNEQAKVSDFHINLMCDPVGTLNHSFAVPHRNIPKNCSIQSLLHELYYVLSVYIVLVPTLPW